MVLAYTDVWPAASDETLTALAGLYTARATDTTRSSMKKQKDADTIFAFNTAIIILIAHAIAYFTHEFSHSVLAWALGFMANPLLIDYGTLSAGNLVMLLEVGDNVQYQPIIQGGHGLAAAAIALAGPFVGNGLLYALLYALAKRRPAHSRLALSLAFWTLAMCAGNIWSYVPIRALTTHADIAIAADGLDMSVLALFPMLLVPSLFIVCHFFVKACPLFIPAIAAGDTSRHAMMVTLTTVWFFFLYGGVGLFGSYGAVSQVFSLVSAFLLMPLVVPWLWHRTASD
jgi:hypothetical protein